MIMIQIISFINVKSFRYINNYCQVIQNVRMSATTSNKSRIRDGLGKAKGYSGTTQKYTLEKHNLSGLPDTSKSFIVLGIESSCDDTGVAIVKSDGTILSNIVYSQYKIHERFGGIVPSLAMEAHKTNIELAINDALAQAGLNSVDGALL